MQRSLFQLFFFMVVAALLIFISYCYIDRQLVWFLLAHHMRHYAFLKIFANDITTLLSAIIFVYYLYFMIKMVIDKVSAWDRKFILCCHSVVIAYFLKDVLKLIFGRYWAGTFICNNPSLISNHVFGFNWFKSGTAYGSFPSGHTAFIVSFAVSLWCLYPKWRILWGLMALLVISGQVLLYYHFVSDVIAGGCLGFLIGYYVSFYGTARQDVTVSKA